MTATLAPTRPESGAGRSTFVALAARELRRFVVNPVFLFAVVMTAWIMWSGPSTTVTEIDTVNEYPAIFLGGFGMMATFWLTRSMRAQRTGRRRHPDHVAGPHRRAVHGRGRAVALRRADPVRVPACLADRRRAVRGVQPAGADRRPRQPDRRPVARRPAARCRVGPLGPLPRRRIRGVPGHLRLGERGDDPVPVASGLDGRSRHCGCSRHSRSSPTPETPVAS